MFNLSEIAVTPFRSIDWDKLCKPMGLGVHNSLEFRRFKPETAPGTSESSKGKLILLNSFGERLLVYAKMYDNATMIKRGHVTNRFETVFEKAKYEYSMQKAFDMLSLPLPKPLDLTSISKRGGGNVVALLMQYVGGPTLEDDFLGIRQLLFTSPSREKTELYNRKAENLMIELAKTHCELQIKATYAYRYGGPNKKRNAKRLLENVCDPVILGNQNFRNKEEYYNGIVEYYVNNEFKDFMRHILLFKKSLEGVEFKKLRLMGADCKENSQLEESLEEICSAYRPIFYDLAKNSPFGIMHGDESAMNASYTLFVKKNDAEDSQAMPPKRAVVYDFSSVFFGPLYLGISNVFADPILNLPDEKIKKLLVNSIEIASMVEIANREYKPKWNDPEFRIFKYDEENVEKAIKHEFDARIAARIRFAGVSFECQLYTPTIYNRFINFSRKYAPLSIPIDKPLLISNKPFSTEYNIPRIMNRLALDLEAKIKDHNLLQEDKSKYERFYSALVKHLGQEIFSSNA